MASITKRANSYRIKISSGYDLQGKQIIKSFTWTPSSDLTPSQEKKELERQVFLFEEKIRNGSYLSCNITFKSFADMWFADYAEKQLKAKTIDGYRSMMPRILSAIGHIRLDKLQPHHFIEFYNKLSEDGISKKIYYSPTPEMIDKIKHSKMTRQETADKAGISINTLRSVANGKAVQKTKAEALSDIFELQLKDGFTEKAQKSRLSPLTINHYHRLISSILSTAVQWQILIQNPTQRVKPPKVVYKEAKYLDDIQVVEMISKLENEPLHYKAMIILLVYSGMRRSELCGLEWKDIDFKKSIINIERNSIYVKGKGIFTDTTKNRSSMRAIKLPDIVFKLLKEHRAHQNAERLKLGDLWTESDRLFTQWDGKPIHPDSITGWFRAFIRRSGLPDITLHSLRHTNATLLIANGTNIRTVSSRLGHSQTSTTTNIYAHAIRSADAAASEVLDSILKPVIK